MALSIDELYNKLFATVNDSKFDSDEVPDLFMVSVFDGEEEVASWDLTEELKENGMSRINYTDDDHDLNIIFMHNDFRDVLEDKEFFSESHGKGLTFSSRCQHNFKNLIPHSRH